MSITLKISDITLGTDSQGRDTVTYTTYLDTNISYDLSEDIIQFMHSICTEIDYTNFDSEIFELTGFYINKLLEQCKISCSELFELDNDYRVELY